MLYRKIPWDYPHEYMVPPLSKKYIKTTQDVIKNAMALFERAKKEDQITVSDEKSRRVVFISKLPLDAFPPGARFQSNDLLITSYRRDSKGELKPGGMSIDLPSNPDLLTINDIARPTREIKPRKMRRLANFLKDASNVS